MKIDKQKPLNAFSQLLDIMDDLREKCPWDKKQTFQSLAPLSIEEVYELNDAILNENTEEIKKELGDLMMHLVFYGKIASEQNTFDIADAIESVNAKLIERHPHIYGDVQVENEEDVKANWEKIKLKKGNDSVLGGVPRGLPALVKAQRIQEKASGVGFDWDNADDVWKKVLEELNEFQEEVKAGNTEAAKQEFGDVLFSLINYSRFVHVHPEESLQMTNNKFIHRFQKMEELIKADGKQIYDLDLAQMDEYWNQVKKQ
ncbi:nucleoside triphosphate pyrophosphohydrolase [Capnocytophaga sp. ARDL2]|uniref:nucleoside triphosphate pyrophosphohydrolase n=1 Tax=Capnocytophaga sp. ARDL2 TaxID=3238809 RepID=UPI00355855C7